MGQSHYVVNLDKREFINPHRLGDGLKLLEMTSSGEGGVACALMLLLAVSNGRGGGDAHATSSLIGSWGGDRIAIVGDYASRADLPAEFEAENIYGQCGEDAPEGASYRDISEQLRVLLGEEFGISYGNQGWVSRTYPGTS